MHLMSTISCAEKFLRTLSKSGKRQNFILVNIFLSLEISKNIHGLLTTAIFMFLEISRSIETSLGDFVHATSSVFLNANKNDRIINWLFSVIECV